MYSISFRRYWLFPGLLFLAACHGNDADRSVVGTLEWERQELVAQSNDPIIEIAVEEGSEVSSDQVILRQDEKRYQALLEQAKARLASADAAVTVSEHSLKRLRRLTEEKVRTDEDLDKAISEHDMALAERRAAKAAVEERQLALQRLTIRAGDGGGRVDALPFKEGERPAPGAVVAVLLIGHRPYARVYVPEPLRASITPGLEAMVHVDGIEQPFHAMVRSVSQENIFTPYFALTEQERSRLSYVAKLDILDERAAELPAGIPLHAVFEEGGD